MKSSTHRDIVAGNVRAAAARLRLRQADLASAIGLSQQAMSRRLSGEVAFDVDELHALATLLKVDVARLLDTHELGNEVPA